MFLKGKWNWTTTNKKGESSPSSSISSLSSPLPTHVHNSNDVGTDYQNTTTGRRRTNHYSRGRRSRSRSRKAQQYNSEDDSSMLDPYTAAADGYRSRTGGDSGRRGAGGDDDVHERQRSASLTRSFYKRVQKPHYQMQHRHTTNATGAPFTGTKKKTEKMEDKPISTTKTTSTANNNKDERRGREFTEKVDGPFDRNARSKSVSRRLYSQEDSPQQKYSPYGDDDDKENRTHQKYSHAAYMSEYFNHHQYFQDRGDGHRRHRRSKSLDTRHYATKLTYDDVLSHPSDEGRFLDRNRHYRRDGRDKYRNHNRQGDDVSEWDLPSEMSGLTHDSDFEGATVKKGNMSSQKKKKKEKSMKKSRDRMEEDRMARQEHREDRRLDMDRRRSTSGRKDHQSNDDKLITAIKEQSQHKKLYRSRSLDQRASYRSKARREAAAPIGIVTTTGTDRPKKREEILQTPTGQDRHSRSSVLSRKGGSEYRIGIQRRGRSSTRKSSSQTKSEQLSSLMDDGPNSTRNRSSSKIDTRRSINILTPGAAARRSPREPSPSTNSRKGAEPEAPSAVATRRCFAPTATAVTTMTSKTQETGEILRSSPSEPSNTKDRSVPLVSPEPIGMRLDNTAMYSGITSTTPGTKPLMSVQSSKSTLTVNSGLPSNLHALNDSSPRVEPTGRRLDAEFSRKEATTKIESATEGKNKSSTVVKVRSKEDDNIITAEFPPMPPPDDDREARFKIPSLPETRARSLSQSRRASGSASRTASRSRSRSRSRAKSLPRKLKTPESYKTYDWSSKGYSLEDHIVISHGGRVQWPARSTEQALSNNIPGQDKSEKQGKREEKPDRTTGHPVEETDPFQDPFRDPSDFRGIEITTNLAHYVVRNDKRNMLSSDLSHHLESPLTLTTISDVTEGSHSNNEDQGTPDVASPTTQNQKPADSVISPRDVTQLQSEFVEFQHNDSHEIIKTKTIECGQSDSYATDTKRTILSTTSSTSKTYQSKDKSYQIRQVTQEASKISLLSPLAEDESISLADEDLMGNLDPTQGNEPNTITQYTTNSMKSPGFARQVPQTHSGRSPLFTKASALSSEQRKNLISSFLLKREGTAKQPIVDRVQSDPPSTLAPHFGTLDTRNREAPSSMDRCVDDAGNLVQLSPDQPPAPMATELSSPVSSLTSQSSDPTSMGSSVSSSVATRKGYSFSSSILTDEQEDCLQRDIGKFNDYVSSHPPQNDPIDEKENVTKGIFQTGRERNHLWNSDLSKANDEGRSCLPLHRLRLNKKKNHTSGGYVNMSFNESVMSSVLTLNSLMNQGIFNNTGRDNRRRVMGGRKASGVTPKTVCSITSNISEHEDEEDNDDQTDDINDYGPSRNDYGPSQKVAPNYDVNTQRMVDNFSGEQIEI